MNKNLVGVLILLALSSSIVELTRADEDLVVDTIPSDEETHVRRSEDGVEPQVPSDEDFTHTEFPSDEEYSPHNVPSDEEYLPRENVPGDDGIEVQLSKPADDDGIEVQLSKPAGDDEVVAKTILPSEVHVPGDDGIEVNIDKPEESNVPGDNGIEVKLEVGNVPDDDGIEINVDQPEAVDAATRVPGDDGSETETLKPEKVDTHLPVEAEKEIPLHMPYHGYHRHHHFGYPHVPMMPYGIPPVPYHPMYPYVKTVKEVAPKNHWHPERRQCFHMFQRLTRMKKYLPDEESKKVWDQLFKSYEWHCQKKKKEKRMKKTTTTYSHNGHHLSSYHLHGPVPFSPNVRMPYPPMMPMPIMPGMMGAPMSPPGMMGPPVPGLGRPMTGPPLSPMSLPGMIPGFGPPMAGSSPMSLPGILGIPGMVAPPMMPLMRPQPGMMGPPTGIGPPMTGGITDMPSLSGRMPPIMPPMDYMNSMAFQKMPKMPNPVSMYESPPTGAIKVPPKMTEDMVGDSDDYEKPEDHEMPPIDEMNKIAFPDAPPAMPNPATMYGSPPAGINMRPPSMTRPNVMPEDAQVPPLDSLERLAYPHMPQLPSHDLFSAAPSSVRQRTMRMPTSPMGTPFVWPLRPITSPVIPPWLMKEDYKDVLMKPEKRHCEVVLKRLIRYKKEYPSTWKHNYGKRYIRVHARCYPEEHAEIIGKKIQELRTSRRKVDARMKTVTDNIISMQNYDAKADEVFTGAKRKELLLHKILGALQQHNKDGSLAPLDDKECNSILSQLLIVRRETAMRDEKWADGMTSWKKSCFKSGKTGRKVLEAKQKSERHEKNAEKELGSL